MKRRYTDKQTLHHLIEVIELVKGNRGSKDGNPYMIPEVKAALKHLAEILNENSYLDIDTNPKYKEI
jgi:hypothetical protein